MRAERHRRGVHEERFVGGAAACERHPVERRTCRVIPAGGAERLHELVVEDLHERPAHGRRTRDAVQLLEARFHRTMRSLRSSDDQAVVERLDDVLVELAQPRELVGLRLQLAVEAAVLERGRHLSGNSGEQREIFAVERLGALLPAEAEHGNRALFGDAGQEVVEPPVAPERDLFLGEAPRRQRVVDRNRVPGLEAAADAGAPAQARRRDREAGGADRLEVGRVLIAEQQDHAVHQERLGDPRDEPLAQAIEIEVAVQIAREADERAAIVVAIAIERPIERRLDGVLHRAREQDDHERREQRDHAVVLLRAVEHGVAREPQQQRVDAEDRAQRRAVDQPALDDHLDIHQPVADDRRRERKRHEAQGDGRQFHRERR